MPLRNWSQIPAGLFHHFHQDWSIEIARALNAGTLPTGFSALVEPRTSSREPNVLTIEETENSVSNMDTRGIATAMPPQARIIRQSSKDYYAGRANQIVIRHELGRVVAVIALISPGNKSSRNAIREFAEKANDFLAAGIHRLVVDLFPPTPRDPAGIHKVIWDQVEDEPFEFPPLKDRIAVSYQSGDVITAYVEPFGLGDVMPEMPLFLSRNSHITVPLERTCETAWASSPGSLQNLVESQCR